MGQQRHISSDVNHIVAATYCYLCAEHTKGSPGVDALARRALPITQAYAGHMEAKLRWAVTGGNAPIRRPSCNLSV